MRSICLGRKRSTRSVIAVTVFFGLNFCSVVAWPAKAVAQSILPSAPYPVGMTQVEFVDPAEGGRPLDFMLIYPATPDRGAVPFKMFMATNLRLYKDAPIVSDRLKHPLVMFSHGAGGNGSVYAWFGEYLASHGYLVALLYHYRANTYDFERALRAQQAVAAAPRYQPGHHLSAPEQGVGTAHRPEIRSAWRGIHKVDLPLSGSVAPRSIPTCF